VLGAFLAASACTSTVISPSSAPPQSSPRTLDPTSAVPSSAPTIEPTSSAPALDHRPLYWFAPLPIMGPTHPYDGSTDFMGLFEPGAGWTVAASHLDVFKLYGEWVAYRASDGELAKAVADIRRRGLALAVEVGPLDPPSSCGQGVEGFAGTDEGNLIARRIEHAGGRIDVLALDEPFYFATVYEGDQACHWSAEETARAVAGYVKTMRISFPDMVVGDTEPLTPESAPAVQEGWLSAFRDVNGFDLAFLHLDVDWSRPSWPAEVAEVADFGRSFGVDVGLIYTGNAFDATDQEWVSAAGERVKAYEVISGRTPDHVLFQSWHDRPDAVLPETTEFTFTNFVDAYFDDRGSLGYSGGGPVNLAEGRPVTVSGTLPDQPGNLAVDGDLATLWNAGGEPIQWIEITLDGAHDVSEIRLVVAQSPAGPTTHLVSGFGPHTSGNWLPVHQFVASTADGDVLSFVPPEPWQDLSMIRVETTRSPSWVAWREIQVLEAAA
jgi:hypothetical protein